MQEIIGYKLETDNLVEKGKVLFRSGLNRMVVSPIFFCMAWLANEVN